MRKKVLAILIIAVIITTCLVGSSLARFVVGADGYDVGRIAKFKPTVTVSTDDLFFTEYDSDTLGVDTATVKSADTDKVIAPGTKNETGVTFTLHGSSEVPTKVIFNMKDYKDVFLAGGTYMSLNDFGNNTFTFEEDYYPVVFTLKNPDGDVIRQGKLEDLDDIEDYYPAETDLEGLRYTLTWKWPFVAETGVSGQEAYLRDAKDSVMGYVRKFPTAEMKYSEDDEQFYKLTDADYCGDTTFELECSVMQILDWE